jgi:hypothetical protein
MVIRFGEMVIRGLLGSARDFSEGLARVPGGYIDQTGEMVIQAQFYSAEPFSEGLACVRWHRGDPWGYIDQTGRMVIEAQLYDVGGDFAEGLASVELGRTGDDRHSGYWASAYIDRTGEVVWQGSWTPNEELSW